MLEEMATILDHVMELPSGTVERLRALATATGRDPGDIALEAIERMIEDIEDYKIAEARFLEAVPGTAVPIEAVMKKYGLDV